jgi:signal peptidase II
MPVIPGFFNLVYVLNKGGAFGIWSSLPPLLRGLFFISFSLAAIVALLVIYWKSYQTRLTRFGIAFLMGGAIGNLLDRLRWGMVVDFLDFYLGSYHWPAFNIADMAICLGLGLVFLEIFVKRDAKNCFI